ncbi:MAG TPA: hypothetical protein VJO16_06920 [Candidatus Acidoferrum sp.]|nr:hypothetical protein [Candidatus Acidoferrum sp.]
MYKAPPPKPRRKRSFAIIALICVGAIAIIGGGILTFRSIISSGITKGPDNMFGDQHLKTAVALIELHQVRFGRYPGSLEELKYTGQWDQIALQSVRYYTNADRTAYYIEVERGWVGKPDLKMPAEFWRGTGYTASLKPKNR